jgi:hypothetical protein
MDQLIQVATGRHMDSVAVNAGGSNYSVGEVLDIDNTGATRTHDAQVEVVAVSGGVVTEARIYRGGAYTVDPTTTTGNSSTSTGLDRNGAATTPGTGATFDLSFAATGWSVQRRTQEAVSATVAVAGTGYSVSDQLTLSLTPGGVQGHGGVDAVFNVDSVGGSGEVTAVSLVTAGNYEESPTNDNVPTGGGGSGCELTVTYQDAVAQDDQLCILQGTAAGAVDPLVGIKLWQSLNIAGTQTTYNWSVFGMTSYSAGLEFQDQVNMSPGLQGDGSPITLDGAAIVSLKDADAFDMEWWLSVTPRRIVGVVKVESASTTFYVHLHLGLLNPLGVTSEFQYPLYVCGCTNRENAWYQDTNAVLSGLTELVGRSSAGGPGYLWYPEGSEWLSVVNAHVATDTSLTPAPSTSTDNQGVYPAYRGLSAQTQPDQIVSTSGTGFDWRTIIWNDTGSALEVFAPPGSGDMLVPCILLRTDVSASPDVFSKIGEIEGLFWTSASDGQSSEDYVISDPDRWTIFQNGNRQQTYSYCAIRED